MKRKLAVLVAAVFACLLAMGAVVAFADSPDEGVDVATTAQEDAAVTEEAAAVEGEALDAAEAFPVYIGKTGYPTLLAAVTAAQNGDTIKLASNVELSAQVEIAGKEIIVDLAGNDISYNGAALSSGVLLVHNGAGLTINDTVGDGGIYSGSDAYAAVMLTKSGDSADNAAKLTVNGGTLAGLYYGITGNGDRHNTVITINGGTVKGMCPNDNAGIYNPQNGTLTINGGTVEGASGIYIKSGTVAVFAGGTIKADGAKQAYVPSASGFNSTGDAVVVDNCNYPGGDPTVSLSGATLVSTNGYQVGAYYSTPETDISPITSTDSTLSIPAGYLWLATDNAGEYKLYKSLNDAVAAAEDDSTIKLTGNVVLSSQVEIAGKEITIDLAGKNISYNGAALSSGLLLVHNGAGLTINDTVGNGGIYSGTAAYAAVALTKSGDKAENAANLTVNGGTLEGYYYAITGNGSRNNTVITINGGTIKGTAANDNLGIFHPQVGTLTVNGGVIEGYSSAIELRSGTLEISGGYLKSTATSYSCTPNGSGTTTIGAAIAIAQHTTKNTIDVVNISGGTFEGFRAFNEDDPQANNPSNVSINITGGVFNSTDKIYAKDCDKFITGGTFNTDPTAYKADTALVEVQGSGLFQVFEPAAKSLTAGTYTTDPSSYLKSGYKAKKAEASDYYTVGKEGAAEVQVVDSTSVVIDDSITNPAQLALIKEEAAKINTSGVADALRAAAKEAIIEASGYTVQDTDIVNIDVTAVVTVEALSEGYLSFSVTPCAKVIVNGNQYGGDVAVPNNYLNQEKQIKVTLPCMGVEPKQILHESESLEAEAFNAGSAASYEKRTFAYDQASDTATVYITHFSALILVESPMYGVITFDANGGEGNMAAQTVSFIENVYDRIVKDSASLVLNANTFTRSGYVFTGWNSEPDGSGVSVADKASVELSSEDYDVTLYAQWKENSIPKTGDWLLELFH